MWRLDLRSSVSGLKNRNKKEWKVKNFQEVETSLREIKVRFDAKLVNQIMTEERGAALRLLFLIKMNREIDQPNMTMSNLPQKKVDHVFSDAKMKEQTLRGTNILPSFDAKKTRVVEQKLLRFEDFKNTQERKILKERTREEDVIKTLLQDRRQKQLNLMAENQEYMQDWEKTGMKDWETNNQITATRKQKDNKLDQFLTMRHVNKIKKKNEAASAEVVDGVTEFVQNMQRLGIEDGANLEALDRPISTGST